MNQNTKENEIENFEGMFERERGIQQEFEKIEVAAVKLKEKYKGYQELCGFVEYIRSIEKVFVHAKTHNWTNAVLKDELIRSEIRSFAAATGVHEDIYHSIHDDFGAVYGSVSQIYAVTEKLLEKYVDCADCIEFILFVREMSVIFIEAKEQSYNQQQIKDRLLREKMETLSSDGHPEIGKLEEIYSEFNQLYHNRKGGDMK